MYSQSSDYTNMNQVDNTDFFLANYVNYVNNLHILANRVNCDALRNFGSNAYKRRSNGWPKRRSN